MFHVRNYTDDEIVLSDPKGGEPSYFQSEGSAVAVTRVHDTGETLQGAPVFAVGLTGEVEGLPSRDELGWGDAVVVSPMVAQALMVTGELRRMPWVFVVGPSSRVDDDFDDGFRPWPETLQHPSQIDVEGVVVAPSLACEGSNVVNLMSDDVAIMAEDGSLIQRFERSGEAAYVDYGLDDFSDVDGIEVESLRYESTVGLPERREGTCYIVSDIVARVNSDRDDLVVPYDPVEDQNDRVIWAKGLAIRYDVDLELLRNRDFGSFVDGIGVSSERVREERAAPVWKPSSSGGDAEPELFL